MVHKHTQIERYYEVMEACDKDINGKPFDYQPACRPDGVGSARECATLDEAVELMQHCFEARRKEFPEEATPEDFRIEVMDRYYLDVKPKV